VNFNKYIVNFIISAVRQLKRTTQVSALSLGFLVMGMAGVVLMASIMKQPQKQEWISG